MSADFLQPFQLQCLPWSWTIDMKYPVGCYCMALMRILLLNESSPFLHSLQLQAHRSRPSTHYASTLSPMEKFINFTVRNDFVDCGISIWRRKRIQLYFEYPSMRLRYCRITSWLLSWHVYWIGFSRVMMGAIVFLLLPELILNQLRLCLCCV